MEHAELRGLIRAQFKTQEAFAKAIGISACSLSKKLNGASEWTASEIRNACSTLGILPEKIPHYFFCPKC